MHSKPIITTLLNIYTGVGEHVEKIILILYLKKSDVSENIYKEGKKGGGECSIRMLMSDYNQTVQYNVWIPSNRD